jgi:hypothetical protein
VKIKTEESHLPSFRVAAYHCSRAGDWAAGFLLNCLLIFGGLKLPLWSFLAMVAVWLLWLASLMFRLLGRIANEPKIEVCHRVKVARP